MSHEFEELADRLFREIIGPSVAPAETSRRQPVHVVYGGADRFKADTTSKLGRLALASLETYAPDFAAFAKAMGLRGASALNASPEFLEDFETKLLHDSDAVRGADPDAWLAWTVRERVLEKLKREPVEDFRIDFEDGYGLRSSEEEDSDAARCAEEFVSAMTDGTLTEFNGIRIKSFQHETFERSVRTLGLFLRTLASKVSGAVPDNFVVTLPKIKKPDEVTVLAALLSELESKHSLRSGSIGIEIMVETPDILFDLRAAVEAGAGRVTSAHFGAFDYTANLGITAEHQHLRHGACDFARRMMQASLAPLGTRLSDSVTTKMPVPVHKGGDLGADEIEANRLSVHSGWREHFDNVRRSLENGFYQSWDLHPAQLVARYAALASFFLEGAEAQGERLNRFIDKATQATMTGNVFDDAASAQGYLNYFSSALSCGVMTTEEATRFTGLSIQEINSGSFKKIMEGRTA